MSEPQGRPFSILRRVVAVFAVGVVSLWLLFMWPKFRALPELNARHKCRNNLDQIAIALQAYHNEYGSLPPAIVLDERGSPMHSWRVLILPHLGEGELYSRYRLDEPWDGPNNRQLSKSMPAAYQCLHDAEGAPHTHYAVITGPGTAFDGTRTASVSGMTDSPMQTLAIVEWPGNPSHWMEPRDIRAEEFIRVLQDKERLDARHGDGTHVLMADGRVQFLWSHTPVETTRAMSTIAGGEEIGDF